MTSALVQRFREDVAPRLMRSIGDNGGVAVVVRVLSPNPDPLLPPAAVDTPQDIPAYAKGITAEMLAADPNLQVSDLRVIVAAVDHAPKVNDMVRINGSDRRVIRVDPIPAAGEPAIYWMYAR